EAGASVADVGCGHGASTLILAQAYPRSQIVGYDNHPASIERACEAARAAGLADRVRFEVAGASTYPAPVTGYDLITFFDCLHDMDDLVGASRRAREALAKRSHPMGVSCWSSRWPAQRQRITSTHLAGSFRLPPSSSARAIRWRVTVPRWA